MPIISKTKPKIKDRVLTSELEPGDIVIHFASATKIEFFIILDLSDREWSWYQSNVGILRFSSTMCPKICFSSTMCPKIFLYNGLVIKAKKEKQEEPNVK